MWSRRALGSLIVVSALAATSVRASDDDLYLPPPTFPEAVQFWHDGQLARALAMLNRQVAPVEDDQPLEALVLRATLLGQTGRAVDAEALWTSVIERQVWMRTFSRRRLVESRATRGDPEGAGEILTELIRADATRHLDLAVRVADTYRQTGDTREAAGLYRQVLSRQSRGVWADAARLGLAAALERGGDAERALGVLREAQLLHRRGDAFQQARRNEHRVADTLGRTTTPLTESQYRTVVRRLRNASHFRLTLALIDEWETAHRSTSDQDLISAERIATLYAQRANAQAVREAQQFSARFPTSARLPTIRLTEFRLAVRMGRTEDARRTGLDLWEGRVPGTTSRQRRSAAELLASYLVAVGDAGGGLDLYRELFRTSQSADDQRAYLWRAGVAALRDGQVDRALANLRGLIGRRPGGDLAPAGLYWLGVAQTYTDDAPGAVRTLRTVAERFPFHYYGMRAAERLMRLTNGRAIGLPDATQEFPALDVSRATRARAEYKAAMVLARAGLTDDAAWYLRRLLERQRRDRGLALLAARASAEAGSYSSVSRILVNHFGPFLRRPARGLPDDFWELVYPRPFWNAVSAAARSHSVDPALLLSLMRQESRFDPEARSPLGAIGLLQIMPYTAEALAVRAGVGEILDDGVDEAALMRPSVNTAIAATLTGNLLDLFDAAIAPVIASYNAGEDRVALWWAVTRDLSEDFFVDTIPYSETRRFVREVLSNYAAYQRVYDDQ